MASQSDWYRSDDNLLAALKNGRRVIARKPEIGGYDDLTEISRGGQGVIYTATQRSTRRRVAIKVLLDGALASESTRRRFEREIDVVAGLRHPNIVQIYDSGSTDEGRLYYIMEFIEGVPLDALIPGGASDARADRPGAAAAIAARPIRDTLAFFSRICDAVNYAHQRGVIHRDIKPSNIRIDANGEPHVLDFGLAKTGDAVGAADISQMSITGQFMGSIPWASPEQAEGIHAKIDVRTDVYSLGVVLYQLLTGRFPYGVSGPLPAVLKNILESPPERPSQIRPEIDDEVETILLKSLAKEPDRRYQSAGELARDIRAYLAGEAIEAKRDSTWYAIRKTVRRHRGIVGFAAFFVIATVAYSVTMSGLFLRARAAEILAADRLRESEAARIEAEHSHDRAAREAAKALAANQFLRDMLSSADPKQQGRDVRVVDVLDQAARQIETGFANQPEVCASLHDTLGMTYYELGLIDRAEPHLERSLAMRRELNEDDSSLYATLTRVASLRIAQGRYAEAEDAAREAYENLVLLRGREDVDTIRSMSMLADALRHRGRADEGIALIREAAELADRTLSRDSHERLVTRHNLAFGFFTLGQFAESAAIFEQTLVEARQILGDAHPITINAIDTLGTVYKNMSRFEDAKRLLREGLAASIEVFGREHLRTLTTMNNLANLLAELDELEEAESLLREGLEVRRRILEPNHPETLISIANLAVLLGDRGKSEEAEALLREALATAETILEPAHATISSLLNNLAVQLQNQQRHVEAHPLLERAYQLRLESLGRDQRLTVFSLAQLAASFDATGRFGEAAAAYAEAVQLYREIVGTGSLETINTINNYAFFLMNHDRAEEALPLIREAAEGAERILPGTHWLVHGYRGNLGAALLRLKRYDEAGPVLAAAYEGVLAALGPEHARTRGLVRRLIEFYEQTGDDDRASEMRLRLAESEQVDSAPTPTATPRVEFPEPLPAEPAPQF